jgi:hypothetical protein
VIFGTGSNIAGGDFSNNAFPQNSSGAGGDNLKTLYLGQGTKAGIYRRASTGATEWAKD